MKRISQLGTILGGSLAVMALAAPAHAQATRTWVSGVGDDINPCSRTAPCKTFATTQTKTATNGEINCLDSAGFGAITITKSLTIRCKGLIGGILSSLVTGIIINAPSARVVLDGLDIDGAGNGLHGIRIQAAGKVWVMRTNIHGFNNNGITMEGTGTHLFVDDSYIIDTGKTFGTFGGVNVGGTNNIANIRNTQITGNGNGPTGFAINASSTSAIMSIQETVLNDSVNAVSRAVGAQVFCVGPSNLVSGAGSCSGTTLFQ